MSDAIRDKFNEVEAKIDKMIPDKLKRLIDENGKIKDSFLANGTTYYILPITKVWNVKRMKVYQDLIKIYSSGKTPNEMYLSLLKYQEIAIKLADPKHFNEAYKDLWNHTYNMVESYKDTSNRHPQELYICTLLITKENEDLTNWSFEDADAKINDWAEENLFISDFFAIARTLLKEYLVTS